MKMGLNIFESLTQKELSTPVIRYMKPVETAFFKEITVGELLRSLQGKEISHEVRYFYTVDREKRLKGIVATRDILFSKPDIKLKEIMHTHVIHINHEAFLEKALLLMTQNELWALPVTDKENHLIGLFEIDPKTLIPSKQALHREVKSVRDVFQLIGLTVDQGKLRSSRKEFRYRMPWLFCNLIGGLICAAIVSRYHTLLCQFAMIAMFIPLMLTLSESVAMQSMTLSLRFLHLERIPRKIMIRRFLVEGKTSFWLALACSLTVALFYLGWFDEYRPLLGITASLFIALFASTTFGSLLPIALHRFSLDPKVASGPVILMITDVFVTFLYLGLTSWLIL